MAMTAIALEANLIQLDTFLKSGDAPLECMTLSDLDGFLTGIAVGPEPIPPREWLPVVWGEEAPTFVNEAQARVVLDAIMGRYNEILREIDEGAPQPILWRASDGATIASDWAKGFAKAVALRLGLRGLRPPLHHQGHTRILAHAGFGKVQVRRRFENNRKDREHS